MFNRSYEPGAIVELLVDFPEVGLADGDVGTLFKLVHRNSGLALVTLHFKKKNQEYLITFEDCFLLGRPSVKFPAPKFKLRENSYANVLAGPFLFFFVVYFYPLAYLTGHAIFVDNWIFFTGIFWSIWLIGMVVGALTVPSIYSILKSRRELLNA